MNEFIIVDEREMEENDFFDLDELLISNGVARHHGQIYLGGKGDSFELYEILDSKKFSGIKFTPEYSKFSALVQSHKLSKNDDYMLIEY